VRKSTKEVGVATASKDRPSLADELLQQIGVTIGDKARVTTVFGEPVDREGITVIPVAKARFAFGGGGGGGSRGNDEGSGGGGGGGALVSPVGYIEVHGDGAEFRRISSSTDVVALVVAAALAALALRRLLAG
jgi:uncharacterized spore protein YtfJ